MSEDSTTNKPSSSNPFDNFTSGVRFFFTGMRMLFRHPSLLGLSLIPVTFTLIFIILLVFGGTWLLGSMINELLVTIASFISLLFGGESVPGSGSNVRVQDDLKDFTRTIALIFSLLLGYFLYLPMARIFLAPLSEALSRRTHLIKTGKPYPKASLGWGRAILEGLKLVAFQAAIIFAALIAAIAFPPLGAPAGIMAAVFTCGLDFMDVPLSVRGLPLKSKLGIIFSNKVLAFGFGFAVYLSLLIPIVNLISLPAGIIGSTLLMDTIEE